MVVTALIIGICLFLFVYWFRSTVILIQRTGWKGSYARSIASANQLSFVGVKDQLHGQAPDNDLPNLFQALQRDYKVLTYLLGHAAIQAGSYTTEQRILMLNFRLMGLWFSAIRRLRPAHAKLALLEMSGTLEYFANVMGHRFATLAAASGR